MWYLFAHCCTLSYKVCSLVWRNITHFLVQIGIVSSASLLPWCFEHSHLPLGTWNPVWSVYFCQDLCITSGATGQWPHIFYLPVILEGLLSGNRPHSRLQSLSCWQTGQFWLALCVSQVKEDCVDSQPISALLQLPQSHSFHRASWTP